MSRRVAREAAVRTLFQVDVGRSNKDRALAYNAAELELSERDKTFATSLVEGTLAHASEIDELIHRCAKHWSLERMAKTDRNILRLAIYEIVHVDDVPGSVAVNEAVELAKMYGDADSGKFVNGVLGNVLKGLAPPSTSP